MYLTASNVAPWLIQRGLLDPAAIVRGDFAFEEIERHNRGVRVYRPTDRPLYVKQLKVLDDHNIRCVEREAAFTRLLATSGRSHSFAGIAPRFADHDPARHAITVELFPDAENLHSLMERTGEIPISIAADCAAAVARFDSVAGREVAAALDRELCVGRSPWILSFHVEQGDWPLNPANAEFVKLIQADSRLTEQLDDIRGTWETHSLLHGDLKWNNVLACGPTSRNADAGRCRIIDWEMVDRGDSAWDVGTILQSWWSWCVLSTPSEQCLDLDQFLHTQRYRFDSTRSFTAAFLTSFLTESAEVAAEQESCSSDSDSHSTSRRLEKCIRFGATRILQTIYEMLQSAGALNAQARLLFEMSRVFLERPELAIELTLGAES